MNKFIFYLSLLVILLIEIHSNLTKIKREELLKKYTKKISLNNLDDLKKLETHFDTEPLKEGIQYDPARIEKLLTENGFPLEYNFIDETNATTRVKDQASCGCCWSHAATTALAYRYHKKGIEVDLSPQDGLSCYLRDCDAGNYRIDPQLNLVKNGTLTEGCLPFSSSDGVTIEPCPSSCKDGSEFKRYYSQNAYMTESYTEENFEDIALIIIDQLINNGPVVSGITVYKDFQELCQDSQKCHEEVYTYDGKSQILGGHAVVNVGYGYLNGKFYWLIQNSWGESACDKGFIKIEFGQVNVEQIAFSEPYIRNEESEKEEIPISYSSIDEMCYLKVSSNLDYNKWENTLDITFQHSKGIKNFNYQCGVNYVFSKGNVANCYYELWNYYAPKGTYEFKDYQSLGTENTFVLDDSFNNKSFKFHGLDTLEYFYVPLLFISEEGRRVTFYYESDDVSILPSIYPNSNSKVPLKNCKSISYMKIIYCDIQDDEFNSFKKFDIDDYKPMVYDILCGYKQPFIYVFKTNTDSSAIFKIKYFEFSEKEINYDSSPILYAEVKGNVNGYKSYDNIFVTYVNVERNNRNTTYYMLCLIAYPEQTSTDLICAFSVGKKDIIKYDNLYLLPYYFPYEMDYDYEIIIKEAIKAGKIIPDDNSSQKNLKVHLFLSLIILLML